MGCGLGLWADVVADCGCAGLARSDGDDGEVAASD